MLDGIKRWLGRSADAPPQAWEDVIAWAQAQGHKYRAVAGEGFVVDGRQGGLAWRLEWGPSQRPYIVGQELRIRSELGLAPDLQMLVLNRQLQEQMERDVYEQYVEGVQTRIDNQTPPEMRWLVMFSKLGGAEMGALDKRYVALGSQKDWLVAWLGQALAAGLQAVRVEPGVPIVLMLGRGRLMLRTALEVAEAPRLQVWLRLFETAMAAARRVAEDGAAQRPPSTTPSLWSPSALPGDERKT